MKSSLTIVKNNRYISKQAMSKNINELILVDVGIKTLDVNYFDPEK